MTALLSSREPRTAACATRSRQIAPRSRPRRSAAWTKAAACSSLNTSHTPVEGEGEGEGEGEASGGGELVDTLVHCSTRLRTSYVLTVGSEEDELALGQCEGWRDVRLLRKVRGERSQAS